MKRLETKLKEINKDIKVWVEANKGKLTPEQLVQFGNLQLKKKAILMLLKGE